MIIWYRLVYQTSCAATRRLLVQFCTSRPQFFSRLVKSYKVVRRYGWTSVLTRGSSRLFKIFWLGTWGSLAWWAAIGSLVASPPPGWLPRWRSAGSLDFWIDSQLMSFLDHLCSNTHSRVGLDREWRLSSGLLVRSAFAVRGLALELVEKTGHGLLGKSG